MPYSTDMRLALAMSLAVVVTMEPDTPALFQTGRVPTLSVMSVEVGGGEVLLEVAVDRTGAVSGIKPLRETATFTERMTQAVRTWRFTPSTTEMPPARRKPGGPTTEAVDSTVLVAGIFRRPSIVGMTLGAPIKDVAPASAGVPFPASLVTPPHPPKAVSPGVVLVEVRVDAKGGVSDAKILIPSPGYDDAALSTARQWTFRPAKAGGANAPAVVYIVFGFQPPRD
jgi:TonB family protein